MSELVKAKQEKRRQAMIRDFIRVFSEYGLDGAYIRRLADGAKQTEASVYRHFENKDDVIRKCTIHYHELTQKELTDVVLKYIGKADLLAKRLLQYVDSVVDICRFLLQVMAHPTYCAIMEESKETVNNYILSWAAALQKTYGLDKEDSESAAFFLNSIINDYILKKSREHFLLQYRAFMKLISN